MQGGQHSCATLIGGNDTHDGPPALYVIALVFFIGSLNWQKMNYSNLILG